MSSDDDMKKFLMQRFDALGEEQVRQSLNTENMTPLKRQVALEFLAEKSKISERIAAAERAEDLAMASRDTAAAEEAASAAKDAAVAAQRAATAAERAASANEAQARSAKHTLTIAVASAIIAAISLIISIFGPLPPINWQKLDMLFRYLEQYFRSLK